MFLEREWQPFNHPASRRIQPGMRYPLAGLLLFLHVVSGQVQGQAEVRGTWMAELHDGRVFLQLRAPNPSDTVRGDGRNGDWGVGQTFPVDALEGLPANDDRLTAGAIKFDMRREAGTLSFDGSFRDDRGAGLFVFTPRPEFIGDMKSLGYTEDLPLWRRYQLAVHDVGPKYIKALKDEGIRSAEAGSAPDKLPLDDVQRAKTHGVTIDYIRELKAQGFHPSTLEPLVRTRDHGVTGEFIKAMKAEGFTGATLEDFVRLRDHGVTQKYAQDMKRVFGATTAVEDLVRARDHGVTPEYVDEIKKLGYSPSGLDEYVRLRDHGVRSEFIRELGSAGFKNVALEDIVRARDHGVTADYVSDLKELGIKDLTLAQAVRLRDHGVTPGFVNHARARGFTTNDPDELVQLKNGGLWRK